MTRANIYWGSVIMICGVILLLDTLNIFTFNAWVVIGPILVIALGIWILTRGLRRRSLDRKHVSIPADNAESARILLRHGAGKITIKASENAGTLIEGELDGEFQKNVRIIDRSINVEFQMSSTNIPDVWFPDDSLNWDLYMSKEIPIHLDIESGASRVFLDLSMLKITGFILKSGASSNEIIFPSNAGFTSANIQTGAALVKILIPEEVAARIISEGGLSAVNVDEKRFPRRGQVRESPDWDRALNKAEIRIAIGVGSVEII